MEGRGGRRRTSFSSSKGKGWITHQQDEISCTEDGTPRGEAAVVDEEGSESFNNNKQKVLGVENNSDGQEAMGRTNKNGEVEDNVKKKKEKKTDISSMTLNNQPTKKQEKDSGGRQPDSRYDGEEAEKEEEVEVEKLKAEVATLRSRLNAAEGKNNNSESSTTTTTTSDYGDGKPDAVITFDRRFTRKIFISLLPVLICSAPVIYFRKIKLAQPKLLFPGFRRQ
jgi:hypothetical protein